MERKVVPYKEYTAPLWGTLLAAASWFVGKVVYLRLLIALNVHCYML